MRAGKNQPLGVAVDSLHREIYVANSGEGRVDVYSYDGRLKAQLPFLVPGADGQPTPGVPVAVALDRRGRLFVVDRRDPMVEVLDFRGRSIKRLALPPGDWKSRIPGSSRTSRAAGRDERGVAIEALAGVATPRAGTPALRHPRPPQTRIAGSCRPRSTLRFLAPPPQHVTLATEPEPFPLIPQGGRSHGP